MDKQLEELILRLQHVYARHNREFHLEPGVSSDVISDYESKLGFTLDPSLRGLWGLSNGSGAAPWFLGEHAPFTFLRIEEAFDRRFNRDMKWFELWFGDPPEDNRQDRVLPDYMEHSRWLIIGEFSGGSDQLYFDAAPADGGNYGQLIGYTHDPEGIWYVAESTFHFLEECVKFQEDTVHADEMRRWLEYYRVPVVA